MDVVEKYIAGNLKHIFPNFIKYLNFYRVIKGRFDFMMFLYKWDPDYRKDLIVTFLAFGLLCYSLITWNDFYDIVAVVIEACIIMIQLGGELSILPVDYRPKHGGVVYSAKTNTHVLYDELSFPMSEIKPSLAEDKLGFYNPVEGIKVCKESPLVSNKINDLLMTKELITYNEDKTTPSYIYSRHQLRYIALRVANKAQHVTNGKLLGFYGLADSFCADDKPLTVRKVFYFDYLLTMEAFRSRIFRGNLHGEKEVYTDLTTYFPVKKEKLEGKDVLRFKPEFYKDIPNLLGGMSILLTENNRVAMLFQGSGKVMDAHSVCLGGAGAMDYSDISNAGYPKDFRDVIRHGIAREVCEETGMIKYFNEVKENTIITGFFRWIDRCGLPEFTALTRAGNIPFYKNKSIDGDEVVNFEEVPVDVKKPEDFTAVLDYLLKNKIHVGLSSLMALHRLVVIAGYGQSANAGDDQKKIYKKIADFIAEK